MGASPHQPGPLVRLHAERLGEAEVKDHAEDAGQQPVHQAPEGALEMQ